MTFEEKGSQAFGYWVDRHIDDQRKLNLRALIDKSAKDPEKLRDIRGQLAPFLRDTMVGFNYIHYAPPGRRFCYTNPLFVRSHDFVGSSRVATSLEGDGMLRQRLASEAGGTPGRLALHRCPTRWRKRSRTF